MTNIMNNISIHTLILTFLACVAFSCTDYQEENVPEWLSVDHSELSFGSGYASSGESSTESLTRTVRVRSGSKWKVGEKPSWLSVQSIDATSAAFEWNVNFIASQNGEYDREGTVLLTAGTESQSVSVSQEGRKGTYVAVESVSISPESLTLTEGESFKLTASISPENASEKYVTWSSDNTSVAAVDDDGTISAKKAGSATITVKTNDGGKTAICSVTVKAAEVPVTGVSLNESSLTLTEGETYTLTATVYPSNATDKSVTWSSNNTSVVTVSSSGVVTAIKAGSATITVKTNNGGKTAACAVTVKAAEVPVTGVSLDKTSLTMTEGETQTLAATVKPDNATDKTVTWSSSNTSVATVSSSGVVTAIVAGSATITVKTNNGSKTATCAVTVKAAEVPVTGVSLNKTSITMTEGETYTLTATVSPSNATDKSVTWSSNNTSVATVSSSGVVTAIKAGSATITVKTNNSGKTASCSVTVTAAEVPVTGVSLNKTSLTMTEGETYTLSATVSPSNATDKSVTWSSSNTAVATVSSSGVVTANKAGSATITVKTNNGGKTATCSLTVNASSGQEAVDLGLPSGLKWGSCNIGASSPEEYGDYYAWGETSTKSDYSWSTYKWCNGSYNSLTKYNTSSSYGTVDNKTKLENSDDVARVKLGGKWRMPTDAEWTELRTKCTWTWTTQNGVYGRKVTGPNGNSIFLPDAGGWDGTGLYGVGSYGLYWSSSLSTVNPSIACGVYFYSGEVYGSYLNRCSGQSVRPVYGDVVSVTSVSLNTTSLTLTEGDTQTLTATVSPSNATDKSVTWSSNNTSVATVSSSGVVTAIKAGSATITVKTNNGGKTATCAVTVNASSGQQAVDLGLPSGLKWGSCNIGASSPEEYGDYYAWGETETKSNYSWSTYKWCNGSYNSLTKYNPLSSYGTVDNKTVLEASDDVARVKLGGKWRMPTDDEWTELRTKCTWTWTTQNGVYGRKVTGPNGNSIFLPAAGERYGASLNDAGSNGRYWSSSLYTDMKSAYYVRFISEGVFRDSFLRCIGLSVRPVSD